MEKYANDGVMPNFANLLEKEGSFVKMTSSIPDISSVSWSTIISGKNPGEHGIYGFTDLIEGTYSLSFPNFATMKEKAYWLENWSIEGKELKHIIVNIPSTYPAKELNGNHVAGFVALDLEKAAYPSHFLNYLKDKEYRIDVNAEWGHTNKDMFIKDLFETLEIRTNVGLDLIEQEWDSFFFVVTGSDRIGHFLYDAFEGKDHKYHEQTIKFFRKIDESLGKFLDKLKEDDVVMMMSDHGMESINQNVYINAYLKEKGYLLFEGNSYNGIKEGTKAFCLDPGRIYIHTNKYPRGNVENKEEVIKELITLFSEMEYNGEKIIDKIYRKEEIYSGPQLEKAPDLVLMAKKGFNLRGNITKDCVFEKDIFEGKHTYDDAFFFINQKRELKDFSVKDIYPIINEVLEGKNGM